MKLIKYKAFTLIEMLIVMGVLVILMVVGVAAGRYSMDKSNEIDHKNGATQVFQAVQSHYTDYGQYPEDNVSIRAMLLEGGSLEGYLNPVTFNGGSEATYYYFTNHDRQAVVICVTLGGRGDINEKGITCVGNGFGDPSMTYPASILSFNTGKLDPKIDSTEYLAVLRHSPRDDWDGKQWVEPVEIPGEEDDANVPFDPCAPCPSNDTNCITGRPSYCDSDSDEAGLCAPCTGRNCLNVEPPSVCCDICEPGDPNCLRPSNCDADDETPVIVEPYDPTTDPCSPSCVPRKGVNCLDVTNAECM